MFINVSTQHITWIYFMCKFYNVKFFKFYVNGIDRPFELRCIKWLWPFKVTLEVIKGQRPHKTWLEKLRVPFARFHFCINIWGCLALSMQFIPGLHGHVTTLALEGPCILCSLTRFSMQQGISGVHPWCTTSLPFPSCPPMPSSWPLLHPFLPPTK